MKNDIKPAYKNKFTVYYKSIMLTPKSYSRDFQVEAVIFWFLIIISGSVACIGGVATGIIAAALGGLLFYFSLLIGLQSECSPGVTKLLPMGYKRKLVYRYCSALLYALLVIVLFVVIIFIIGLIVFLCVTITSGGVVAEEAEEESEEVLRMMGVYGGIFGAAYILLMYSAGMLAGYIAQRRVRNVFLAVFFAALICGMLLTSVPSGFIGPLANDCFTAMSLPYLAVTVWAVLAVGMFCASVYIGYRHEKPDNV